MTRYILTVVSLVFAYGVCEESTKKAFHLKAVGGSSTTIQQFPYTISLHEKPSNHTSSSMLCGGFIVSQANVVTACHCVEKRLPDSLRIRTFYAKHGILVNVNNCTCHPNYTTAFDAISMNDIAVLQLAEPLKYNPGLNKIDLYESVLYANESLRQIAFATGWGQTRTSLKSLVIQVVELPVISKHQCKADFCDDILQSRLNGFYSNFDAVMPGQICAVTKSKNNQITKSSCPGDSGGPLVIKENNKEYVIGVNGYGTSCSRPTYPSVFTKVAYYLPWLKAQITFD